METIDHAVESGVTWVGISGNDHQRIWTGPFKDTVLRPNNIHNYTDTDERNYITIDPTSQDLFVEMRWDDAWNRADCDLDIYMYRVTPACHIRYVNAGGIDPQNGVMGQYPHEEIEIPTLPGRYFITIRKRPAIAGRVDPCTSTKWMQLSVWQPHTLEHAGTGGTLRYPGDTTSPGALTVGAAPHYNTSAIQAYSGQGPTTDGRTEPDVVGADCGEARSSPNEVTPGTSTQRLGTKCWFWGTSQAAPHVAGLVAMIINRYDKPDARQYTAKDVAEWIKATATQRIPATDPNNTWGHGFATLPVPAPMASLSPVPKSINVGQSLNGTLTATNVGTAQPSWSTVPQTLS